MLGNLTPVSSRSFKEKPYLDRQLRSLFSLHFIIQKTVTVTVKKTIGNLAIQVASFPLHTPDSGSMARLHSTRTAADARLPQQALAQRGQQQPALLHRDELLGGPRIPSHPLPSLAPLWWRKGPARTRFCRGKPPGWRKGPAQKPART